MGFIILPSGSMLLTLVHSLHSFLSNGELLFTCTLKLTEGITGVYPLGVNFIESNASALGLLLSPDSLFVFMQLY